MSTHLHHTRVQWRATAAKLAAAAQSARVAAGDEACTDRAIARRFCLASARAVAAWFDAESGHAVTLGDVLAMPRELARETLTRALAALDDGAGLDARTTIDRVAIELGQAVRDLHADLADDGQVNQHAKHAANFARIASIALRGVATAERAK